METKAHVVYAIPKKVRTVPVTNETTPAQRMKREAFFI
jgi:hypothetical protein